MKRFALMLAAMVLAGAGAGAGEKYADRHRHSYQHLTTEYVIMVKQTCRAIGLLIAEPDDIAAAERKAVKSFMDDWDRNGYEWVESLFTEFVDLNPGWDRENSYSRVLHYRLQILLCLQNHLKRAE